LGYGLQRPGCVRASIRPVRAAASRVLDSDALPEPLVGRSLDDRERDGVDADVRASELDR
jgi:hypothetical protein